MRGLTLAVMLAAAGLLVAAEAGTVPVLVQGAPVQPERLITMTGKGTVKAMPDTAIVSGGVVTQGRNPHDAARDNAIAMQRAVAALKAMGLTDKQITTSRVTFEPQYELDRNGNLDPRHRIIGYNVTNRIIVTLSEKIDRAGEVFDALIQNGANDSATVHFELRNTETLENEARAAAAKDAAMKADVYVKALRLELGAVRLVSEPGNAIVGQIQAEDIGRFPDGVIAGALQRVPGVRIEADELTISATVTVTWALR